MAKHDLKCESGKIKIENEKEEKENELRSECLRRPQGWLGHLKLRKSSQTLDRGSKVEEISAQNLSMHVGGYLKSSPRFQILLVGIKFPKGSTNFSTSSSLEHQSLYKF